MRLATTLAVAITYKYKSKSGIQQIRSFARILPGSYSPTANSEVKLCPASQRQCKPCIFFGSLTGRLGWIDGRTKARRELLPPRTGARHGSSSPVFRERGKAWEASRGGGGGGGHMGRKDEKRGIGLCTDERLFQAESRGAFLSLHPSLADSRNVITRAVENC